MPARDLGHKHTIEGLDIYDTDPVATEVLYVANSSGHLGHDAGLTYTASADRLSLLGDLQLTEITDPAAPATNSARLYVRDSGGKTQLVVRFPTGAIQVISTEP